VLLNQHVTALLKLSDQRRAGSQKIPRVAFALNFHGWYAVNKVRGALEEAHEPRGAAHPQRFDKIAMASQPIGTQGLTGR
jgi:hypothetical protein